jgi:hypothetical protein
MEKIITCLANIKRFPSLEIWKDIQGMYHTQCSPSFDTCEGTASDLTESLIALLKDLKDYFTEEEIEQLNAMGISLNVKENKNSYTVKNCPACVCYGGVFGCEDNYDKEGRDTYCEKIDDCLIKGIIKDCQNAIKIYHAYNKHTKSKSQILMGEKNMAEKILEKFVIMEKK